MKDSYPVPAADSVWEEEIKHSRFITCVFNCDSSDAFKEKLALLRVRFPAANHYCQAFLCGNPNMPTMGCSDDGEPSGSAGRPMLAVLQGSGLCDVGAIVIRYFGGVKLGVGGLVRAYSSGLKLAIAELPVTLKVMRRSAYLCCSYAQLTDVEHLLQRHQVLLLARSFTDKVNLTLAVPNNGFGTLQQELGDMSQGQLQLETVTV